MWGREQAQFLVRDAIARASAALAAAGAWDTDPLLEIDCQGAEHARLFFSYTRGAAGGAFEYRIETSPESSADTADVWYRSATYAPGAVVAGADTNDTFQRNEAGYQSQAAAIERVEVLVELRGTVERIRIPCHETGVVGTPGTLAAEVKFS